MAGNPALPRHPTNPVGQTAVIRQARRDWSKHIKQVQKWLLARFEEIPRQRMEANWGRITVNRYDYQVSAGLMNSILEELVTRLASGPTKSRWLNYVRDSYRKGTAEEVINLQNIAGDRYPRTVASVFRSDPWLTRIALIEARVFEEMKGLEGDTARELGRVLSHGVENGLAPREVADSIRERFSVSQSRANRIARTEITGAYRRARLDEDEDANKRLAIRTGLLWFSALSPTSRQWHMAKHGIVHTQEEVREFYSTGGNAINCKCSQASVLLDKDGNPENPKFIESVRSRYTG